MRFNSEAYLKLYPRKTDNVIENSNERAIEIEPKNDKVVEVEEIKNETETTGEIENGN